MQSSGYVKLSDQQIQCVRDCIENGYLWRKSAAMNFCFGDRSYSGRLLFALVSKGILIVTQQSPGKIKYPICVKPNYHHPVILNIGYVGSEISVKDKPGYRFKIVSIGYNEATEQVCVMYVKNGKMASIDTKQVYRIL